MRSKVAIGLITGVMTVSGCLVQQAPWSGTQLFGTESIDHVNGMAIGEDGSVVMVGYSYQAFMTGGDLQGIIWHRKADGAANWELLDNQSDGRLHDVAVDQSGNVYAVGTVDKDAVGGSIDVYVIKTSATGVLEWSVTFGGQGYDFGQGILIGSDGNVYVTGYTRSTTFQGQNTLGEDDVFVTQLSSAGVVGWTALLGDEYSNITEGGIAETPTGELLAAYNTFVPGQGDEITLAKLATSGALLAGWPVTLQLDSPNEVPYRVENLYSDIAVDAQGDIYLGGRTDSSNFFGIIPTESPDAFVLKVSGADGQPLWARLMGLPYAYYDSDGGIAVDAGGHVALTGVGYDFLSGPAPLGDSEWDIMVAKWDTNGNLRWWAQYGTVESDQVADIAFDQSGQLLLCGETSGDINGNFFPGSEGVFLMKLDGNTGSIVPATAP